MSFLFASSHLHAVRFTRPAPEEEEEEENVNPESLPRSGGVRASSHLEERGPESARRADGSPATRRADAASDWLGRLNEQLDPQRTRSSPAAPDERPRRADAEHEPDAEPDHDADEAPGAKSEEAPENENTRTWYRPPESSAYDPDSGVHIRPEDTARPDRVPLPQSRLLERRMPPGFRDQAAGQSLIQGGEKGFQKPVFRLKNGPGGEQEQRRGVLQNAAATRSTRQDQTSSLSRPAGGTPQAPQTFAQSVQTAKPGGQNSAAPPSSSSGNVKDTRDPLTILSERFAAFPEVVKSLQGLNRVPTGRLMIEKLATVADKIQVGSTFGKSYIDPNGVFRVRRDIDPATLGHEFQHLGEMLFGTEDPFIKVSHPSDATAYPGTGNMGKEFRAMRIQNQLLLERARMMRIIPLLNQHYYFDDKTKYPIPGGPLPPAPPVVPIPFL